MDAYVARCLAASKRDNKCNKKVSVDSDSNFCAAILGVWFGLAVSGGDGDGMK